MFELPGRRIVTALIGLGLFLGGGRPLAAQQSGSGCRLLSITAANQERTQEGADYLWGNFRAACGDARIASDSAIVRERIPGVISVARLIDNVSYADSTRSLTSDSLRYTGADERVVAMGNVVLTMRKSGATLSGPRVEFHRVTSAGAERTIATGRPHLDLKAEGDQPPSSVDADRIELFREESAWTFGDVEISRTDVSGYADSSFFDLAVGTGVLHGNARVVGDEFELRGDSIRIEFEDDELRAIQAYEGARAIGTDFDIAASQIRVRIVDGDVDDVQAFGSRSAALSGGYHLLGDSLRFRLRAGAMDSTFAIGRAVALEDTTAGILEEPGLTVTGDKSWLAGDTIVASFRPRAVLDSAGQTAADAAAGLDAAVSPQLTDSAGAVLPRLADSAGNAATDTVDAEVESELEQLRTVGNARAYYLAVEDESAGPPARNYLIGQQIAVFFEGGRAVRVSAEKAIGVYLDPDPDAAPVPGEGEQDGGPPVSRQPIPGVEAQAGDEAPAAGLPEEAEDAPEAEPAPARQDSTKRLPELPNSGPS